MKRPKKQYKSYYDYNEYRDFLEKKYGYDERDFFGRKKFLDDCKKKTEEQFDKSGWWTTIPREYTEDQ